MASRPDEYALRIQEEIRVYNAAFLENSDDGLVDTPDAWGLVEWVMARKIETATGKTDTVAFVASELDKRPRPQFLSLGAGTCVLEINWIIPAMREPSTCTLECVDLNPEIMAVGRRAAEAQEIPFTATVMDINELTLESDRYDVILAYAALHHFVELDHIAREINRALAPDGVFVTMDICARNGFLLWPETEPVVDRFWQRLPESYRYAHTLGPEPVYCEQYPKIDCAKSGFECLCSEEILPALQRHLETVHFIPAHAFARRFFDTMFGPNFDMRRFFDLQFFLDVILTDEMALERGQLKPETFFGVYRKNSLAPRNEGSGEK